MYAARPSTAGKNRQRCNRSGSSSSATCTCSATPPARLRGVASLPALQAAIADASAAVTDPDGVLLTGDLVQDDPEGYRWIRHMFGASPVPVLCLAGNHDLPDHMRATLRGGPFRSAANASSAAGWW